LSKKYEITARYKINQSSLLTKCLLALHCLSAFAVLLSSLDLEYKALLWSAVFFSLLFYSSKERDFNGLLIRHSSLKGWELADLDGIYCPIEVLPSTVISSYLLVMHFNQKNKQKQSILICKDALINDDYRKLMVALKIAGLKKDEA
jgi:hypothetical protein